LLYLQVSLFTFRTVQNKYSARPAYNFCYVKLSTVIAIYRSCGTRNAKILSLRRHRERRFSHGVNRRRLSCYSSMHVTHK